MTNMFSLYNTMLRIRRFEEKVSELVGSGEAITPCHLYIGQEAIAAGVCAALKETDVVFSTHRSHGHYLAKGGSMRNLMKEVLYECSMHVSDPNIGFPGSSAIVGGSIPHAVGAALAFKMDKSERVAVAFFGDGAASEGVFYESLNFAVLYKLPVVFVCENNGYSTHLPTASVLAETNIWLKAFAMGLPSERIDGNDVIAVNNYAADAVDSARGGCGPVFLECMTYRWKGHVGASDDIDKGLRSREELDYWISNCPIKNLRESICDNEHYDALVLAEYEVEDALNFARQK